jgi:hypothetical protein
LGQARVLPRAVASSQKKSIVSHGILAAILWKVGCDAKNPDPGAESEGV